MMASSSKCYPKRRTVSSRIALADSDLPPQTSLHWQGLPHEPQDRIVNNVSELITALKGDIARGIDSTLVAKWSCITGYCEALSTHKDQSRRYRIFPIPVEAIARMVQKEFIDWIRKIGATKVTQGHREVARIISNEVWNNVISKASVRDELHANSVYVCLRGTIDKKALDCFGASLATIVGLNIAGFTSYLTLSEDHAYESHLKGNENQGRPGMKYATCEVAIPGKNKASQQKRGREISESFSSNAQNVPIITPQTSWLYMAEEAVVCNIPMTIAAIFGNINCQIEKTKSKSISSRCLYEIKRELMWTLYDMGILANFPFALSELGECEENVPSPRGMEWIAMKQLDGEEILMNEKLFIESVISSRTKYGDSQVYPYCYAGHYHKDAGRESTMEEYRLVEAMRLYYHAARVASGYLYDLSCLQLVKTITKVTQLMAEDIFAADTNCESARDAKLKPRCWARRDNSIAFGTWFLGFFDACLLWEEKGEGTGKQFVEVLNPLHKFFLGKLFLTMDLSVRQEIMRLIYTEGEQINQNDFLLESVTEKKLNFFTTPKSKRLTPDGILAIALAKEKLSIGELEIALPTPVGGRKRRRHAMT